MFSVLDMNVVIAQKRIMIDGRELEYYPYYFSIWKEGIDHRETVKSVLDQWASALESLESRDAVYLPYFLCDQICNYLKAVREGRDVVLTDLEAEDAGYAMDLDDLSREMYSEPELVKCSEPKLFGRYPVHELIHALRNAEIAT